MKKYLKIIFLASIIFSATHFVMAATGTIDATNYSSKILSHGDRILWRTTNGEAVTVSDSVITGEIWGESVGWIKLDPGNSGVLNDGSGNLSGYAWGENAGWINFDPTNGGVSIDTTTGEFDGYAWSQNYGWIQFDCSVMNGCVETDWRPNVGGGNCTDPAANNFGQPLPCTYNNGGGSDPECDDGDDNDGDLLIDWPDDPGCQSDNDDEELEYICSDGKDNDNDGLIDLADPGCAGEPTDNDESTDNNPGQVCTDMSANNFGQPAPCTYDPTSEICDDPFADNYNSAAPCTFEYIQNCQDASAINFGQPLPCRYIPPQDVCTDRAADNFGEALPCLYTPPPVPTCFQLGNCPTGVGEDCTDPEANNFGMPGGCVYNPPPDDGGCTTDPTIIGQILCTIEESIDTAEDTITDVTGQIKSILGGNYDILTKIIGIVGVVAGGFFVLIPALFGNPLSFSELLLVPYRMWSLLMIAFGLKKRTRPWGTVYDAVTKQPLDPAVVTLYDSMGKEFAQSITDIDGRYGFLVPPGVYKISAKKTHYTFPSHRLIGRTRDEIYLDLYFGTTIEIKQEGEVITKNIPMDPENFDWNEYMKRQSGRMKYYKQRDLWIARISDFLFSFGFFFSFLAVISAPKTYNIVVFVIYLLMLVLKEIGLHMNPAGQILVTENGIPLSFAVLRVYSRGTHVEVATRVADRYGKYYCLIKNGTYDATVERKNADESYTLIHSVQSLEVTKGFINNTFEI